ncbi:acyl transferase/acyl hydrolase/lysophospholipase [Pyronema domesticum]|nr:acyl transferase/acyl hydrolase/lysophospholipase [Pyronema domesticum]
MARIQEIQMLSELPRPCMFFDLIGATSTGGLIAIMFGRLQISTTEAVEAYTEFSGSIFQEKKWRVQNGSYKATKLKEAFQKIIAKYSTSQHPDKIMLDTRETSCKTIRSLQDPNLGSAQGNDSGSNIFKPIKIGPRNAKISYIDGAMGHCNPISAVLEKAKSACVGGFSTHSGALPSCILSIGTGMPVNNISLTDPNIVQRVLPTNYLLPLLRMITNANEETEKMERRFSATPGVYFRLNVQQGMQGITLEQWHRIGEIIKHTECYLEDVNVKRTIDELAHALCERRISLRPRVNASNAINELTKELSTTNIYYR